MLRSIPSFLHRPPASAALMALMACTGAVDPVDLDDPVDRSPTRSCRVLVPGELPQGVDEGAVAGSFSDWEPIPLEVRDDGSLSADLGELVPDTYAWKYVWDGTFEGPPPPDVPTTWLDGVENRALVVQDCRVPSLRPLQVEATAEGSFLAEIQWVRGRDGAALDPSTLVVQVGEREVAPEIDARGVLTVRTDGLTAGKHSLRIRAADLDGRLAEPVWVPVWVEETPFAFSDGVMYFAFLDRFRDGGQSPDAPITGHLPGAGYRGGDLVGLRDALREGYFDDLGVRSIWLSPIAENPDGHWPGRNPGPGYTGYHGYWPAAPRTVEARLGTTEVDSETALEEVIEAAHARGIRIVLDIVLNHVHQDHPWIDEHPEWFDLDDPCTCGDPGCEWEVKPRTCRFAPYLPDVEYRSPGAVEAQLDEMRWWLENFDVDGLRLDAVKHMDHVVLRRLALDLRSRIDEPGGAHVYLVGETFTGTGQQGLIQDYVAEYELDGQFDFPLFWRIREAVQEDGSFRPFAAEARVSEQVYGPFLDTMSPFFGNHDVARLATELAGCSDWGAKWGVCEDALASGPVDQIDPNQERLVRRLAMAWALVATRPGVPLLYYGDEVGLAGANDPDNRRDMPWTLTAAQRALRTEIAEMAQVRAQSPALRRGQTRELWVDDTLYVVARTTEGGTRGDDEVVIAWFSSDGGRSAQRIPIPTDVAPEGTRLETFDGTPVQTVEDGQLLLELGDQDWTYGVVRGSR